MALVVFLRGVNVGGHRTFRPSQLVKELADFDVVNIGAAGTFVVRKPGSQAKPQVAPTQVALPCAGTPQPAPQVEQLFGSVVVSVQVPPQLVWPGPQAVVQLPPPQTSSAAADAAPGGRLPAGRYRASSRRGPVPLPASARAVWAFPSAPSDSRQPSSGTRAH